MNFKKMSMFVALFGLTVAAPAWADPSLFGKPGPISFTIGDTPSKSQVVFLSDAPMEKVRGTADGIKGTLTIDDGANLGTTKGKINVPIATMRTGNPMRDQHLADEEWLNGKKHPMITFDIASVDGIKVEGEHAKATVHGSFSMNGASKAISAPAEITYKADKNIIKITTKFTISLKDYNIKGVGNMIGSKIGETVNVEGSFYGVGK